ncbi:lipopolysaccharide biosynthesis protein [Brachybacterium huguangmaarense]
MRLGDRRRGEQGRQGQDSSLRAGSDAIVVGIGYLASFAYPLVSLPLFSRVLGAHDLGRLLFALALVQLIVPLSDFGFGRSALRRIAVASTVEERSRVVAETLGGKAILWAGGSAVLMAIVLAVPRMRSEWELYAAGLALIGVGAAYPTWLLQGMGRVTWFALLMALSRLVALGLLVLTVHGPDDLVLAMVWQQFPLALAAVASWVMIGLVWKDVHRVRTTPRAVVSALRDSWPMFVANLANVTISASNTVVLGMVAVPVQVAYFGAAERFGNAVRGIMTGVSDAMLPRLTRGEDGDAQVQRFVLVGVAGAFAAAGITLVVAAPWFVPWYLGAEMTGAAPVTQIIGVSLVLSGLQMAQFLHATARHRFRLVARIAAIATVCHVVLLFPAAWFGGAVGAACVAIVSEALMASLYAIASLRRRRAARAGRTSDDQEGTTASIPETEIDRSRGGLVR